MLTNHETILGTLSTGESVPLLQADRRRHVYVVGMTGTGKTGAAAPDATQLAFARRLFARTIETPGGLKIQTIHAFCERLLHLFPFEANVAAGFRVAEEREACAKIAQATCGADECSSPDCNAYFIASAIRARKP